ncbi:MAG: hypothetical protein J0626_02440, partial [Rhodospirillaceae bacterium]|nr:hypothetical protein [Rhodospirillaceae bacterium]
MVEKFGKIPAAEQSSVRSYTGGGYDSMNDSFRAGSPSASATRADKGIRGIMVPMKAGTVLSRKISMSDAETADFVKNASGTVIQEFGISSTSIHPQIWA